MNECPSCSKMFTPKNTVHKWCSKECRQYNRNTTHYVKHREKIRAKADEYRLKYCEKHMLYAARSRARKKGVICTIMPEDIVLVDRCPVLGFPINFNIGKGSGGSFDSPALDRIKPELGYVPGNVRVISNQANKLKNNASVRDLMAVLDDLRTINK